MSAALHPRPSQVHVAEEYLDIVNELLPKATPEGAYSIGLVSALCWLSRMKPTRSVLECAAQAKTIAHAIDVFEQWREIGGKV